MATTLSISEETKNEFDRQREVILSKREPRGELSADEFLKFLLSLNAEE